MVSSRAKLCGDIASPGCRKSMASRSGSGYTEDRSGNASPRWAQSNVGISASTLQLPKGGAALPKHAGLRTGVVEPERKESVADREASR